MSGSASCVTTALAKALCVCPLLSQLNHAQLEATCQQQPRNIPKGVAATLTRAQARGVGGGLEFRVLGLLGGSFRHPELSSTRHGAITTTLCLP